MTTRVCPECGRTLETHLNRWRVEMWPQHNIATISNKRLDEALEIFERDKGAAPGFHAWESRCVNSAQPV